VQVVPELESQPVQLANADPAAGAAVRETAVPAVRLTLQDEPQSIPFPLTVPDPVPDLETLRTCVVEPVPGLPEQASIQSTPSIAVETLPPLRVRCMGSPPPA